MKKKLLIISNNVISNTNNNGKTIFSFINGLQDVEVAQLFFSGEIPRIFGYKYFRITDKDIINGWRSSKFRGDIINPIAENGESDDFSLKKMFGRNIITLSIRDLLWKNHWISDKLNYWLNQIKPEAIFFVAGDALFPYQICNYICDKYNARLSVYITDDYIMPRFRETFLQRNRRERIKASMKYIVRKADAFFTISEQMRQAYIKVFNKDSVPIFNMTTDLYTGQQKKDNIIRFVYTGSLYYGRDQILGELAKNLKKYCTIHNLTNIKLYIYCNNEPDKKTKKKININEISKYEGALNKEQMKVVLNTADVLVFVESFNKKQVEKTRYSLSTKISEYMSVGKPILAIGPIGIGSMEYLKDTALCVNKEDEIYYGIEKMLDDTIRRLYGKKSRVKFNSSNNKINQEIFAKKVLEENV